MNSENTSQASEMNTGKHSTGFRDEFRKTQYRLYSINTGK